VVPLARYSADISPDLLSVYVRVRPLDIVEARDICHELSLNNIDRYLPPASNA
jgi:hypothetical protein